MAQDPEEMKFWVTTSGKESGPAEVFAEVHEDAEWSISSTREGDGTCGRKQL